MSAYRTEGVLPQLEYHDSASESEEYVSNHVDQFHRALLESYQAHSNCVYCYGVDSEGRRFSASPVIGDDGAFPASQATDVQVNYNITLRMT